MCPSQVPVICWPTNYKMSINKQACPQWFDPIECLSTSKLASDLTHQLSVHQQANGVKVILYNWMVVNVNKKAYCQQWCASDHVPAGGVIWPNSSLSWSKHASDLTQHQHQLSVHQQASGVKMIWPNWMFIKKASFLPVMSKWCTRWGVVLPNWMYVNNHSQQASASTIPVIWPTIWVFVNKQAACQWWWCTSTSDLAHLSVHQWQTRSMPAVMCQQASQCQWWWCASDLTHQFSLH